MATLKEKENLIEAFKGPHFYRVCLWGYGAETSYMKISKQAVTSGKHTTKNMAIVML